MSRFLIFHFMIWISRSLFNETPYKLPHFFPSFLSFIFRPHITHLYPSLSLNIPLNSPFQLWILSSKTVYIFFANCLFVKAVILSYIHLLFSCYGLLVSTENDSFFSLQKNVLENWFVSLCLVETLFWSWLWTKNFIQENIALENIFYFRLIKNVIWEKVNNC